MISFKVDNLMNMRGELKAFTDFLRTSGVCDDDIFASKLISCELLTNVIRHGGDAAQFTGAVMADGVVITVTAESLKNVDIRGEMPDVFSESGRGFYIVKNMCRGEIERGPHGEVRVFLKRQ
ncbi:MAG: ATP-binding protein [Clostridia bacterium]|nr:ATP-binding protein [Clostridia bacterium]